MINLNISHLFCTGEAPSVVSAPRPGLLQRLCVALGFASSEALLVELHGERAAVDSARLMVQGAAWGISNQRCWGWWCLVMGLVRWTHGLVGYFRWTHGLGLVDLSGSWVANISWPMMVENWSGSSHQPVTQQSPGENEALGTATDWDHSTRRCWGLVELSPPVRNHELTDWYGDVWWFAIGNPSNGWLL